MSALPPREALAYTPPMQDAATATRIIELIARSKNLSPEVVTPGTSFDELQIDSLEKINLSFEVEDLFAISIPDASLNSLRTVGDVIDGVERLQLDKARLQADEALTSAESH